MAHHSFVTLWMATITVALAAGARGATQDEVERAALQRFEQATHEYVAVHRQAERGLPPLQSSSDGPTIHQMVEARAAAIRRARADAKVGDVLPVDVRTILRRRIRHAFDTRGRTAAEVLGQLYEEGEEWQQPVVNGRFSWRSAVPTPPCVLAVLPALPEELQYRFVGPDLVLVDIDANLIVDVLPDALAPGARAWGPTGTALKEGLSNVNAMRRTVCAPQY